MSYRYSQASKDNLLTCHYDLVDLFEDVITVVDHSIICGYRDEKAQTEAFAKKRSTFEWPDSRHNQPVSLAVDAIPFPVDWDDLYPFYHLAGVVKGIAKLRGIKISWGGDWIEFKDYGHYQLERKT